MTRKPKETKPDLVDELEVMARHIMAEALAQDVPLPEKAGVFKAVSNFLAISHKLKPPNPEDDGSFSGHAESLANFGSGERKPARRNGAAAEPE